MTNLALVGSGKWGKNYIRTINQLEDCTLSPKNIKTRDYKDLLSYKDIEGVIIATPGPTHFQIAKEFIEKGFNVLIEKPMTTSIDDAVGLQKIKSPNSIVMVGHIYLYNPLYIEFAKEFKKSKEYNFIEFEFGRLTNDINALWEWGPHSISMALDLMGENPLEVSGWGIAPNQIAEKSSVVYARLVFSNNRVAIIKTGWLFSENSRKITAYSKDRTITFDDNKSLDKMLPLKEEVKEFIFCIKEKKQPKTDISNGVEVIKILEVIKKSMENDGQAVKFK